MINLTCPLCESPVRAPNATPYRRLHCSKCHTTFHLNKAGRTIIGEPPDVEHDLEELKQTLRDLRSRIPIRQIVTAVVALLAIGTPVYYLLGSSQGVAEAAEGAARALAADDVGYVKSIAAPGTSEDVAKWFTEAHSRLVRQRERWYSKEERIEVQVGIEDREQGKCVVGISIRPGFGTARDVSLADPSAATAAAAAPCNLETVWTKGWGGRWMLDGRDTSAKLNPSP